MAKFYWNYNPENTMETRGHKGKCLSDGIKKNGFKPTRHEYLGLGWTGIWWGNTDHQILTFFLSTHEWPMIEQELRAAEFEKGTK